MVRTSIRRFDNYRIDGAAGKRIQEKSGNLFWGGSASGCGWAAIGGGESGEGCEEGRPDFGIEREVDEFALTLGVDEAGGFKLLDVVRERGGRNGEGGEGFSAAERTGGFGDLLEEPKALGVGEGFEDLGLARPRELFTGLGGRGTFGDGHGVRSLRYELEMILNRARMQGGLLDRFNPSDKDKDVATVGHSDLLIPTLSAKFADRMGHPFLIFIGS